MMEILSNKGMDRTLVSLATEENDDDAEKAREVALLFSRDRLKELKQGINMMIEAFTEILELDPKKEVSITYKNYRQKLQSIEEESWARLRQRHFNTYHHHDNDLNINRSLSDRFLEFISTLDSIKQVLVEQLQNTTKREETLSQDVKHLRRDLLKEKQTSTNLKWKLDEVSKELTSQLSSTGILSEQLQEKQKIIQQLQRNGTVQLWEKEKKKLLDNVAQHERELEAELTGLQQLHEDTKDRLNGRIRELDEKLKMEKMKDVVSRKADRDDLFTELENSKRRLYTLEKDMSYVEREIADHQKLFVGCINGIRKDFTTIVERDKENGSLGKGDVRKMTLILNAIYNGVRSGRLEIMKADLPLHYIALDEEIIGHPSLKKLTKSQTLRPVERHLEEIDTDDKTLSSDNNSSHLEAANTHVRSIAPPTIVVPESTENAKAGKQLLTGSQSPVRRRRPGTPLRPKSSRLRPKDSSTWSNTGSNVSLNKTNHRKARASSAKISSPRKASTYSFPPAQVSGDHPELINPSTGTLDIETAMKYFKSYTKEQILDYFKMFTKYDKDKNFSLDLSETMDAIHSTVGDYYTENQIKEVMEEVDINNSNSIDFYEYLGVSSMLNRRSGKSEVFRSGIVKHGGTSVSKMCIVQ
ncbi:uncharacterized protein LOC117123032 isoform X2 [Anneissia japonica]|uniref:uncharacterized protein LOC117123032 isoform X2 n=1 Tax=Anneissia japonica TaxID=1529436 RepID=UPI0014259175|nr:uncharacterized protein LOC117123032 isoform X2 [Anneissia japonica]